MGAHRDPNSVMSRVNAYVQEHPGCSIQEITSAFGLPSLTVSRTLYVLMAHNRARREGGRGAGVFFPISPNMSGVVCECCQKKYVWYDQEGHCKKCAKELEDYSTAFHEGWQQGWEEHEAMIKREGLKNVR